MYIKEKCSITFPLSSLSYIVDVSMSNPIGRKFIHMFLFCCLTEYIFGGYSEMMFRNSFS